MCTRQLYLLHPYSRQFVITLILATGIIISGCSESSQVAVEGVDSPSAVSGTASAGSRTIPENSVVEIRAVDVDRSSAEVAANGEFEFGNATGPAILRLDMGDGQNFYAIVPENSQSNVTINVHSYSDFVARNWYASRGLNIETEFNSTEPLANLPDSDEYAGQSQGFAQIVAGVLEQYQLADVDLLTAPFITDGNSIDGFLTANPLVVSGNEVTLTITDPVTMTQSTLFGQNSSPITTNVDLTAQVDNPPDAPTAIRVLAADEQELIVLWDPARDDQGIANYRIFRDGVLVDTSPFPIYSDSRLNSDTEYTYQIESVDGSGQISTPSTSVSGRTTLVADEVAPPSATDVIAVVRNGTINVEWNQINIDDVARFSITREANSQTIQRLVTTTTFDDLDVVPGIEYCYLLESIDGSGNRSASSGRACATLPSQGTVPPEGTTTTTMEPEQVVALANCGSLPISSIAPSNDVDQPVLLDLDTLVTGALDPTNRHFWDIDVTPGGYFLVMDFTRTSGSTNIFEISRLTSLGSEQSRIFRVFGTNPREREAIFLNVENAITLRLQVENDRTGAAGSYQMGLFRNGSAIPSPYFVDCPTVISLGNDNTESMSLGPDQDGFALIAAADLPANLIVDTVRQSSSTTVMNIEARLRFSEHSANTRLGRIFTLDTTTNRFAASLPSLDTADFLWIRFDNERSSGNVDIEFRLDP